MKQNRRYLKYELHQSTRTKSNVDQKVLMLVLADILIVLISYLMALLLRFDFVFSSIPEEYLMGYLCIHAILDH